MNMIDYLWDEGAFHDYIAFHFPGWAETTPEELYDMVKEGDLSLKDLCDFNWEDYLAGPL